MGLCNKLNVDKLIVLQIFFESDIHKGMIYTAWYENWYEITNIVSWKITFEGILDGILDDQILRFKSFGILSEFGVEHVGF